MTMTNQRPKKNLDSGSFRDPSGFIFYRQNNLYRQINQSYQEDFDLLIKSGLYQSLVDKNLLIPHQEVKVEPYHPEISYKIIQPEKVEFISYPYEWSFTQLKDAALATLAIQKQALDKNMVLKDASAYNIQFVTGKPVFIDTLSFEKYEEGRPWTAYRQFCQHFLAPLVLAAYVDFRLLELLRTNIDGIPLDLASKLLPMKTKLNFALASHIHLHAKSQQKFAGQPESAKKFKLKMNKNSLVAMVDNLETAVKKLKWRPADTEWGDYYSFTNYSDQAFDQKKKLVDKYLKQIEPDIVWDLGANTGEFTRLINKDIFGISFDIDPIAVEKNYRQVKENQETNILPLVLDLTNPPPAVGWANKERKSLIDRGPADAVLALALIHHLAISNNLPFDNISRFFTEITDYLIIEFVPKTDSQVEKLLASREDIFDQYTQTDFEQVFSRHFEIIDSAPITGSKRHLYLMRKK